MPDRSRRWGIALAACLAAGSPLLAAAPASAHPHVWVSTKADILFDSAGRIAAVRHEWVFDAMYSAAAVMGLEHPDRLVSREEFAPLAKTNIDALPDFDDFTFMKAGGRKVVFAKPTDYWLEQRPDKLVALHFTLPLATPVKTGHAATLQIYDPTYFTDFEIQAKEAIRLVDAPAGCSQTVLGANPLVLEDGKALAKAFDTGLVPSDDFALKMASRVIVACP